MFRFKQFTIKQDKTAMKVGTDGVLIGAWADIHKEDKHALDIGCGTGLIALMIAQRSQALVDAVEIEECSAQQAKENVEQSAWSQRVEIHNIDIANFNNKFKYDLVISNPPYFNNSLLSPDSQRTTARHTTTLSYESLINSVMRLLTNDGRFSLILPKAESEIFEQLANNKLYLWRRTYISGKVGADYNRVMSEYRLTKPNEAIIDTLAIRASTGNDYTNDYKKLTADFYLKF